VGFWEGLDVRVGDVGGVEEGRRSEGEKEKGGVTSGQMIVVMMDAGTTIPPMPRPARTRIPHAR